MSFRIKIDGNKHAFHLKGIVKFQSEFRRTSSTEWWTQYVLQINAQDKFL